MSRVVENYKGYSRNMSEFEMKMWFDRERDIHVEVEEESGGNFRRRLGSNRGEWKDSKPIQDLKFHDE